MSTNDDANPETIDGEPDMIERVIRELLRDRLRVDPCVLDASSVDTPLLGRGIALDSVEAMSLASAIEQRFDIEIDDEELTEELFASIGALCRFVEAKCVP